MCPRGEQRERHADERAAGARCGRTHVRLRRPSRACLSRPLPALLSPFRSRHTPPSAQRVLELLKKEVELCKLQADIREQASPSSGAACLHDGRAADTSAELVQCTRKQQLSSPAAHTHTALPACLHILSCVHGQVEAKIMKEQRRMILMEQLKSIKRELGLEKDDKASLIGNFTAKWEPKKDAAPEEVRR